MVLNLNANLTLLFQAASAIESFTIESPMKKMQMDVVANKENIQALYDADEVAVPIKGIPAFDEPTKPVEPVEDNNKLAYEDEPLLRENSQRFVLFPIKYHEVSGI
jgi:ribonucleoside-diphosphate reductase subunit M2